jgi:hypothetical protein
MHYVEGLRLCLQTGGPVPDQVKKQLGRHKMNAVGTYADAVITIWAHKSQPATTIELRH